METNKLKYTTLPIKFRYSTEKDKVAINRLMLLGFGIRNEDEVFKNIRGRYLLAILDDEIIAMSGIIYNDIYKCFELDWTTTEPKYRGQGVMLELLSRLISTTDEKIVCSCWRLRDNKRANLHSLMKYFGFKEIMRPRSAWDTRVCSTEYCETCVGRREKDGYCKCYEDLWIREAL